MSEPTDCRTCGEDVIVVSFDGKHMARVRRSSKCRRYQKRHNVRDACQSEVLPDRQKAVDDWNEKFGK